MITIKGPNSHLTSQNSTGFDFPVCDSNSRHTSNIQQLLSNTKALATKTEAQARSTRHKAQSQAHANTALTQAEKAPCLCPRDPSAHVLNAMALNLMNHKASALRSLDLVLSPPRMKSLAAKERANTLLKGAELKMTTNRRRQSTRRSRTSWKRFSWVRESRALCLLGQCHEWKGVKDEAREAYEKLLRVEPGLLMARQGLNQLGS